MTEREIYVATLAARAFKEDWSPPDDWYPMWLEGLDLTESEWALFGRLIACFQSRGRDRQPR